MCHSLPSAVSVGVSCFTLVAISLERYFAICRPLHSRSWQTLSHAYRCIAVCWVLAAALTTPTAVFQKHIALAGGAHMCREIWPNQRIEQAYTVLLDLTLLVLPVIVMSVAYSRVVHALIFNTRSSLDLGVAPNGQGSTFVLQNYRTIELRLLSKDSCRSVSSYTSTDTSMSGSITPPKGTVSRSGTMTTPPTGRKSRRSVQNRIRHSNPQKIRQNKMRVIRMLFVVVLEFFICWTPVYVLSTWIVFHVESAYQVVTPLSKTLFHLLSYVSSCCNPITYCFMNKKFREAFLRVFQCRGPPQTIRERRMQQLQHKRNAQTADNNRRSTAVSRLSERFNPLASTTTISIPEESIRLRNPGVDRCRKMASTAEEDTTSASD
ncbi:cholecystokinin receptor [Aplysia californica]|uniref:Cholecystokinin receptor n=1 Tax=Aplysia californica TaxID=6500 RepID=A0ABM0ZX06_APLCA|nr:cholecystokinin receptor [Aplysia californica]